MTAQNPTRQRRYQTFRYAPPNDPEPARAEIALCESDLLDATMQIVPPGGQVSLHAHTGMDEFWMIKAGRARFYGPGHTLMGEFEPGDGLLIPRGTDFAYENVGKTRLELLRVGAHERGIANERINRAPPHPAEHNIQRLSGRVL